MEGVVTPLTTASARCRDWIQLLLTVPFIAFVLSRASETLEMPGVAKLFSSTVVFGLRVISRRVLEFRELDLGACAFSSTCCSFAFISSARSPYHKTREKQGHLEGATRPGRPGDAFISAFQDGITIVTSREGV